MSVTVILLIISLVLLILAAINWPPSPHIGLGWLGLAFFVLAQVIVR